MLAYTYTTAVGVDQLAAPGLARPVRAGLLTSAGRKGRRQAARGTQSRKRDGARPGSAAGNKLERLLRDRAGLEVALIALLDESCHASTRVIEDSFRRIGLSMMQAGVLLTITEVKGPVTLADLSRCSAGRTHCACGPSLPSSRRRHDAARIRDHTVISRQSALTINCAPVCFWTSSGVQPGATSLSTSPLSVTSITARSVMISETQRGAVSR